MTLYSTEPRGLGWLAWGWGPPESRTPLPARRTPGSVSARQSDEPEPKDLALSLESALALARVWAPVLARTRAWALAAQQVQAAAAKRLLAPAQSLLQAQLELVLKQVQRVQAPSPVPVWLPLQSALEAKLLALHQQTAATALGSQRRLPEAARCRSPAFSWRRAAGGCAQNYRSWSFPLNGQTRLPITVGALVTGLYEDEAGLGCSCACIGFHQPNLSFKRLGSMPRQVISAT